MSETTEAGVTPGFKICSNPECSCANPQPLEHFNKMDNAKDGKQPRCKTCKATYREENRERHRAWSKGFREENRERINAEKRAGYAKKPQLVLERNRKWATQNPEKIREWARRYAQDNPDRVRVLKLECYQRNKKRYLADAKARYYVNRDAKIEAARRWREKNPDKRRAIAANYKARKKGAVGHHAADDVAAKFELQGGVCYYCSADLAKAGYHIEHKIPLVRGGSNWPANICCACPTCNWSKKDKPFWDFISELAPA